MLTFWSGRGNVTSCICMKYPQLRAPAISWCACLQPPLEQGNELGIKSVNYTALAVHHKSYVSARIRDIYWPSVKKYIYMYLSIYQRRLDEECTGKVEAQECLEADSLLV